MSIADATLGALVAELLKTVIKAINETKNFKSHLDRLNEYLLKLKPFADDIDNSNVTLGRPITEIKKLRDLLNEGTLLVNKCLTIDKCNVVPRYFHSKKLRIHLDSIREFIQTDLVVIIAMDAKKVLVGVEDLRSNVNSGFRGSCGVPEFPKHVVGFGFQVEELKAKIMLNDEVRLVGISAPPGCGKTTLATMLCHDQDIKGMFKDNIFYVTVSKPANFQVIVQKLFPHKDPQQPLFQSDEDAVHRLRHFLLQQGPDPILLVFDDVWPEWERHILNIKFQDIPGYKVLVTSRSAFPNFDYTYNLKFLNHQDATTLFCNFAFGDGKPDVSNDFVEKVVRRYKRFPLAP